MARGFNEPAVCALVGVCARAHVYTFYDDVLYRRLFAIKPLSVCLYVYSVVCMPCSVCAQPLKVSDFPLMINLLS